MRPENYRLARIEPREELAVHLIPSSLRRASDGLCGVSIWDASRVEPVEWHAPYRTITEFLEALRKGEAEPPSCMRCCLALRRFQEQDS